MVQTAQLKWRIFSSCMVVLLGVSLLFGCDLIPAEPRVIVDANVDVQAKAQLEVEKQTREILQKAIESMNNAPGNWGAELRQTLEELGNVQNSVIEKLGEEARATGKAWNQDIVNTLKETAREWAFQAKSVAGELQRLVADSISYAATEAKCGVDFIGARLKETLEYLKAKFIDRTDPPQRVPFVCNFNPPRIRVMQTGADGQWAAIDAQIVHVYGFNFSYLGVPEIELVDSRDRLIKVLKWKPVFETPYMMVLNFQAENFYGIVAGAKFRFKWPNPEVQPNELVAEIIPTATPTPVPPTATPTPVPPPTQTPVVPPIIASWRLQPVGKKWEYGKEFGWFNIDCTSHKDKKDRRNCPDGPGAFNFKVDPGWELDLDRVGQVNAAGNLPGSYITPARGYFEDPYDVNNSKNRAYRDLDYIVENGKPIGITVRGWAQSTCPTFGGCIRNWWRVKYLLYAKRRLENVSGEVVGGGPCPALGPPHVCGVYPNDKLGMFENATPDHYRIWIRLQVPPSEPGPEMEYVFSGSELELDTHTPSGKVFLSMAGNQLVVRTP